MQRDIVRTIFLILPVFGWLSSAVVVAESRELLSTEVIPGLTSPVGTTVSLLGDSGTLKVTSPTALSFGAKGELYVSETHRFRHGIADNRSHLYWIIDDLASRTTTDRLRMHEKWQDKEAITSLAFLTEISEVVRVLQEPGAKGVFGKQQVYADGLNDVLDGTAAGVFAYEGTVRRKCAT